MSAFIGEVLTQKENSGRLLPYDFDLLHIVQANTSEEKQEEYVDLFYEMLNARANDIYWEDIAAVIEGDGFTITVEAPIPSEDAWEDIAAVIEGDGYGETVEVPISSEDASSAASPPPPPPSPPPPPPPSLKDIFHRRQLR